MSPEIAPTTANLQLRPPTQPVERRVIGLWLLRGAIAWGIPLGALIAAMSLWPATRVWLAAPLAAAVLVFLAVVFVAPWRRYRVHRWEITERASYAQSGWLVVERRVAPTTRIQTVDAVRGPLEQLFGLATLRVTTASSAGAITIQGLDQATAEAAVAQLTEVAELSEGDAT